MKEDCQFQQLVYEVSSRLIRTTAETLNRDIMQSLAEAGESLQADRVGRGCVSRGSPIARVDFGGYRDGSAQVSPTVNLAEMFPFGFETMVMKAQVHSIPRLSDFPPHGDVDRAAHESIGTKTILSVPLTIGGDVHHVLSLHATRAERDWSGKVIPLVRLLGDVFVSALQRIESDIALKTLLQRLDLAADSTDIGLWEYFPESRHFWVTDKVRDHFGFSPEQLVSLGAGLQRIIPEDREMTFSALSDLVRGLDEASAEYRLSDPDGSIRWMFSRGRLVRLESQPHPRIMGVTVELTARKEMELMLRAKIEETEALKKQLEVENQYLRYEASIQDDQTEVLGTCEKMRAVIRQVHQVARTGSTVLLTGETGTGKGLIAQTIHRLSDRGKRPMVQVNCAALPGALVESELFGREKGAFTGALSRQKGRFELADGSTLFLDEIAEMPLETQAKLLRVLQDGEFERLGSSQTIKVDVRLIAATNRDLEEEVQSGRFRRDLYYRLNVFPILVPPLRERSDDIPQLVWEFVGEFGERMGKKMRRISTRDMNALQSYHWPGNIRELRNVIEHSLIVSQGDTLEVQRLEKDRPTMDEPKSLEEVERNYIQLILKTTRGRIKGAQGAASILKMNPSTLYSRMRKLGISGESV
jgi:PAS domain S-box-containing protein